MKVIIDTNVAIDLMEQRDEFFEDAEKVFLFACTEHLEAYFTATTMTTLFYILHQFFHDNDYVKSILKSWNFAVQVLSIQSEDCLKALNSSVADYEDAVISEVASREGIDYIITRNTKDFQNSTVKAVTPSEFIKIFMTYNF